MFIEEAAESYLVTVLRAASAASTQAGEPGFKIVDTIGAYEIDEDNIDEFVKISPACLLGVADNAVVDDIDADWCIQITDFRLTVNVVARGAWKHRANSDNLNALCRMVKTALRGIDYGPAQGNTEGMGKIIYRGRTTLRLDGGLLVGVMQFDIRTLDK